MSYLQDKQKREKKILLTLLLLFVFFLVVVGVVRLQASIIGGLVSLKEAATFSFDIPFSRYMKSNNTLAREVERLEGVEIERRALTLENQFLKTENEEFRKMLHATSTRDKKKVLTRVVGESLYNTILVDRGESDGVATGDALFGGSGGLLGIVVQTFSGSSRVELVGHPESLHTYRILDTDIMAEGRGRALRGIEMRIPQSVSVSVGQTIALAAFPLVPVGVIADISTNDQDAYKKVLIEMYDTIGTSRYMYISPLQ